MMLPVEGPKTSLMEDLSHLGLVEGNSEPSAAANKKGDGYAKPDAKGGDYAGPDDGKEGPYYKEGDYMLNVGDGPAGSRKNVPVRSGGLDRADVGPSASNPAKNEDEEGEGETVAENETTSNKMVPAFLVPSEEEVAEEQQVTQEQAAEDRLTKAWDVVKSYFSEDNDGLNEEGLRGVINAMGYALNVAVEDIEQLTADNTRLSEAVAELTGLLQEQDDEDEDEEKAKDDEKDEKKDPKAEFLAKMMAKKNGKKDDYSESTDGAANLTESEDMSSLLQELRGIGTEDSQTQAVSRQSKIVEAYQEVLESCREIVGKILDVIAEDEGVSEAKDLQLDADDERVQIAQHFESIADDAEGYLARLADGDVPFKIAEADLSKLQSDMQRGFEVMQTVE